MSDKINKITVRMSEEEKRKLTILAEANKKDKSKTLRLLVNRFYEQIEL